MPSNRLNSALARPLAPAHRHRRWPGVGALALLLVVAGLPAQGAATPPEPKPSFYARQLDLLKQRSGNDQVLAKEIDAFVGVVRGIMAKPLLERAYSLDELKNAGSRRLGGITDQHVWSLHAKDKGKGEMYALSLSDSQNADLLVWELPQVAAAYRLTGDRSFLQRAVAQIDEMCTWQPLQRPGWTLPYYSPMPEGGDGVWLATGQDLIALSQTLDMLPAEALPAPTRAKVDALLDREIRRIVDDWKAKRSWYVREQATASNQWVVPTAGLVVACVAAGPEKYPEAFELGIANLLKSAEAFGADGSVSEGLGYAMYWTMPAYCIAALAARDAGDPRLFDAPFLKNFPNWVALCLQPGESFINCFDFQGGARGKYHVSTRTMIRLSALTQSPGFSWLIGEKFRYAKPGLYGLLTLNMAGREAGAPPLWGLFRRAHWAVWRSSWRENASGVWVRGGDRDDRHDHNDRGHVNFIPHGQPLLIEAGTINYGDPLKKPEFDSVVGHNVLQVGGDFYPKKMPAPITVNRLDQEGGDVIVPAGAGYPQAEEWTRRVVWDRDEVTVTDTVRLKQPDRILFRWHLGSEQPLEVKDSSPTAGRVLLPAGEIRFPGWIGELPVTSTWTPPELDIIQTPAADITVTADKPITLCQGKNYDATLKYGMEKHVHTTLLVQSAGPVDAITIVSRFRAPTP